jgi:transketolase
MFGAHHHLANIVVVVDLNGQQALGYTDDVLSMAPMGPKWKAFGWDVHEVDGHDIKGLYQELSTLDSRNGPPHVVIAHTTFGKGVDFMENQIQWHYLPMSDQDYESAIDQVGGAGAENLRTSTH